MKINMFPLRHCVTALFLLALPAVVQAQFTFTTNDDSVTIIGYTGPGGAVLIPATTNGYAVTGIGEYSFAYCTNLTSVTIPSSIKDIEDGVFLGCAGLTNISVDASNAWFSATNGVLFDQVKFTLIDYPEGLTNGTYTIPYSVTNIGDYAFASCSSLTSMFIASNVISVGEFAFSGCAGLTQVVVTNTIINGFRLGITSLGTEAFSFCDNLTTVSISTNVALGPLAFAFCTNLASAYFEGYAPPDVGNSFYGDSETIVYYPPGAIGWGPTFGGAPTEAVTPSSEFEYSIYDGSVTIQYYSGWSRVVVIPGSINGYPVTGIEPNAFGNVTSLTIPDSVTSIAPQAFEQCEGLTNVIIPNGVTSIGFQAFSGCTSLTSVTIPGSVISIGGSTFSDCSSLKSVTISDGITSIAVNMFLECRNLAYVIIPGSVTSIGQGAFVGCESLSSVTIPSSVTSINNGAFGGCSSLTSAYFKGNASATNGGVFNGDPATVYYLPGTTGWGTTFGGVPTELWNPQAMALTTANGRFGFNITGPTNATIVVQACTNLTIPVWLPVSTKTLSSGGTSFFSDPQWKNYPNRYYRFGAP